MILCGNRRMKSQLAEDRNGACAASFRHDNQCPVVNPTSSSTESDMARSSTATAPTPKKASRQLQT
jgi:hypothetical protein